MAEKMYKVLDDQKYSGKHKMYYGKGSMGRINGDVFPATELFGNADNIAMALEGAKDLMKKDKDGKEYLAIKGKSPKIKLITSNQKAAKK